jgi:hypothetical protein
VLAPVVRRIDGSPKAAKRDCRQECAELALPRGAVGLGNSTGRGYVFALSLGAEQWGKPGHVSATNGCRSVAMGRISKLKTRGRGPAARGAHDDRSIPVTKLSRYGHKYPSMVRILRNCDSEETRTVWLDVALGRGARGVVGESKASVAALPRGGELSGCYLTVY